MSFIIVFASLGAFGSFFLLNANLPSLRELLQPQSGAGSHFKTILTVFSPLLTSLIGSAADIMQ